MALKFTVAFQPGQTSFRLSGNIDERVGPTLAEIRRRVVGQRVVFDCDGLGTVNSVGVAAWLTEIQDFAKLTLIFVNCPSPFIGTCLLVPGFILGGTIESLYVRYACVGCARGEGKTVLIERADVLSRGGLGPRPCPHCGGSMTSDEDEGDLLDLLSGGRDKAA